MDVRQVRTDLFAEQQALDELLATLEPGQFAVPTASPRWSVADQIGHLAYFDDSASLAISDPERFAVVAGELLTRFESAEAFDEATLDPFRSMPPDEVLLVWRTNRARLADASATLGDDSRVIWYGPSMGSKSFLTARLMECFVHGQDIADAVGVDRVHTDRIQHVARLGFITRDWSYANRGFDVPEGDVRVSLTAPSGVTWHMGDVDSPESISGPAVDFCLVVAQRRHVDDTSLIVEGDAARDWMLKAQIFAGPATVGPAAVS